MRSPRTKHPLQDACACRCVVFLLLAGVAQAANITYTRLPHTDTGVGKELRWLHCVPTCPCGHKYQPVPCPVAGLEALCRSTPHCAGFNTNGWLKSCVSASCGQHAEHNPSVDTYVGSAIPPGPWPPPPPPPSPSPPPQPKPYTPPPPPPPPPPSPPPFPPPSPPAPLHLVDDFHFPAEEAAELAAAAKLTVVGMRVSGNNSGIVQVRVGNADPPVSLTRIGQRTDSTAAAWTLRALLASFEGQRAGASMAVLERDWERWGVVLYLWNSTASPPPRQTCRDLVADPTNTTGCFLVRKGVGETSKVRRTRYALEASDPSYFTKARESPTDWLKERMVNNSADGEPTFAVAASLLPPSRDYTMTGNVDAHTKFSVSLDGRVRLANYSIYSPMEKGDVVFGSEASVLLFDPRNHTGYWPSGSRGNFSDYKAAVLGRYSRAATTAAWSQEDGCGFAMQVTPNTFRGIQTQPYDHAELLIRLEDHCSASGPAPKTTTYHGVLSCAAPGQGFPGIVPPAACLPGQAQRRTVDPAEFYAHLWRHTQRWAAFHEPCSSNAAPAAAASCSALQLRLDDGQGAQRPSSEGTRLVDMARAVISGAMTMWVGSRPNYGDGANYWSVSKKDAGSLPLESFALNRALLLWGHAREAADRVWWYVNVYVRNASGLASWSEPGMIAVPGEPGSLDLKQWAAPAGRNSSGRFEDSYADYGRWMELWADTARAMEGVEWPQGDFVARTWPLVQGMVNYTLRLHDNATRANLTAPATGLIIGPAEHDTCASTAAFFSINAWTWRGWVEIRRFLGSSASLGNHSAYAAALDQHIATLASDLAAATELSTVRMADGGLFLPPWAALNFTPYQVMIEKEGFAGSSSYANFRYYSEMLSSGFFSPAVADGLNEFRESHTGTLSGMTRFQDHLDDMPATGYAQSAIELKRVASFQALLFGHIANYHSRGTFNAPEQLSLYGDGVPGLSTFADSYRGYLSAGHNEVDIDFCVPSTTLPAIMLRWMLVYTERDADTLSLFRAAPRRFFRPAAKPIIEFSHAPTRYGSVDASVTVTKDPGDVASPSVAICPAAATAAVVVNFAGCRGFVGRGGLDLEVRLRTFSGCSKRIGTATVTVEGQRVEGSVDRDTETVTVSLGRAHCSASVHVDISATYA